MKKTIFMIATVAAIAAFAAVRQISPVNGEPFSAGIAGKVAQVVAFSPVASGTVAINRIWSAPTYTNAQEILTSTSTVWAVTYSNIVTHAVMTNRVDFMPFPVQVYCNIIASNATTTITATTNTWPVQSGVFAVTNEIASGTCSGGVFTNAPNNVWLGSLDTLIFTGTATGGFLRIVTE